MSPSSPTQPDRLVPSHTQRIKLYLAETEEWVLPAITLAVTSNSDTFTPTGERGIGTIRVSNDDDERNLFRVVGGHTVATPSRNCSLSTKIETPSARQPLAKAVSRSPSIPSSLRWIGARAQHRRHPTSREQCTIRRGNAYFAPASGPMEILYKYVSACRALDCIPEVGDGALRATQPAALNDPFECAVAPIYKIADASEEDSRLADALTKINESVPITEEDVHNARQEHGSVFTSQLFAKQVSTKLGIVSFTSDPFHPLMWSHYTLDGSGFVIGYHKPKLEKLVHGDGDLVQVLYQDELPIITGPTVLASPSTNLAAILSVKSDHWIHEKEWRLIVEMKNTVGTGKKDRHQQPINLVRIPNEAVVRVYCTERTPPGSVQAISERLADPNNRYQAKSLRKLTMSSISYGYVEVQG